MTAPDRLAPALDATVFRARFADLAPAFTAGEAASAAARCLYCFDAPCIAACPTSIDVPSFIRGIATGNLRGAARVIFAANPLGHSCARACPVEVLCEGACVLAGTAAGPVAIGRLQRHATESALTARRPLFAAEPSTGKSVAIIGAGPAGLAAARDLRRFGHGVTVFEARERPGGLGARGVAEYKLTEEEVLAEARLILDLGVELRVGVAVGRDVSVAELLDRHDAVLLAAGLGRTRRLGIPGEDLPGVVDALDFIEALKARPHRPPRVGRRVAVVGAGNTAIDAATQARRLGAERVVIVYRRRAADAPAWAHEIELAKAEGCEFRFLLGPVRVLGAVAVEGLECARMDIGPPDDGGRARVTPIPGSLHVIEADMVIRATGQDPLGWLGVLPGLTLEDGRVAVDPATGRTSHPRIFAAGDCVSGGAEIVHAAAEGLRAARGIHALLGGSTAGKDGTPCRT